MPSDDLVPPPTLPSRITPNTHAHTLHVSEWSARQTEEKKACSDPVESRRERSWTKGRKGKLVACMIKYS